MDKNDIFLTALRTAAQKNQYRVRSNEETYCDYNKGWQACVDFIDYMIEELENERDKTSGGIEND